MHARLQPHRKYFEKHVAELRTATDAAIMAHKKQLIDRQMLVERLSNMAIELFARACVLSRTQRLLRERGLEAMERELHLCDLFCVQSGRRFKEQRENLESPQDATRRAIAEDLRDCRRRRSCRTRCSKWSWISAGSRRWQCGYRRRIRSAWGSWPDGG